MKRFLITILLVVIVLESDSVIHLFSTGSATIIVFLFELFGFNAQFQGSNIVFGDLAVPWTEDCSGINSLLILWGVVIWSKVGNKYSTRFFMLLLGCLPAALLANTIRVLCIISYRTLLYPEIEPQELHFLFGFLSIIPFIILLNYLTGNLSPFNWSQLIHICVILSLTTPLYYAPGGLILFTCVIYCLIMNYTQSGISYNKGILLSWLMSAFLIAFINMESLWLVWLLIWPQMLSKNLFKSATGWIILSGTIQPLAMMEIWQWVIIFALLWETQQYIKSSGYKFNFTPGNSRKKILQPFISIFFFLPIFIPLINVSVSASAPLPRGMIYEKLSGDGYRIYLIGQPNDVNVYLFEANNNDRHHPLASCMRFKGVTLTSIGEYSGVYETNDKYMREYFINKNGIIMNYYDYVFATINPFSDAGIHVITESKKENLNLEYFSETSNKMVEEIESLYSAS
jgi:exosortase/archaeosortase family protein